MPIIKALPMKAGSHFEAIARKSYNRFGAQYQKTRDEKSPRRAFNDYLELPAMLEAVGKIRGKRLLDVGCGAGIHIKEYLKRGAFCKGIDISTTMIALAKKNCREVDFQVAIASKMPYENSSFDIVTASLCMNYVDNLDLTLKEINRVLVRGGTFYYSIDSPTWCMREKIEDKRYKVSGIGEFVDKKTGKRIIAGRAFKDHIVEWEMLPGMKIKTYQRSFRTQLLALARNGFELVDFIDCKPIPVFRRHNPEKYAVFTRMPIFSIYVLRKKM